jgi:lipopolysaccharide export system permease protein
MRFGVAIGEQGDSADFVERPFDVQMPPSFFDNDEVRARDMTWQQLRRERVKQVEALAKLKDELAAEPPATDPNSPQAAHQFNLEQQVLRAEHLIRLIDVEMLMRPALSLGCLCFILVGCPVGIWFSRGDYLSAFITCFLPIVLSYYPLMLCGTNLAKEGRFNELILVYAADVIVGMSGVYLFRRLLRN